MAGIRATMAATGPMKGEEAVQADRKLGARITIKGVSKSYTVAKGGAVQALAEVDLDIAAGEFVSIVGPSGCGKSTLMMLVAGLIAPSSGTIAIDDEVSKAAIGNVAVVFQRDLLLDWRTVLDNVLLPIEIKRQPRDRHRERALTLLENVGLKDFSDRYPRELSGGMRQRVALCRALVQHPGILLMDEPFGALDALTREQMNLDLQRMWMRDHNTVLFITHSIEEAVLLSDRVVVMSDRPGKVAEVYDVRLARPRGAESRGDPSFLKTVEGIRRNFMALGILSEV